MDEPLRLQFQKEKYGANAIGRLDRTNEHTAKYAAVAKRVAATAGVPCVDLFALTLRASDGRGAGGWLFEDGIHFNATGQGVVFEGLKACLESMAGAGALDPEGMDPDWPFGPQLRGDPAAWRRIFATHAAGPHTWPGPFPSSTEGVLSLKPLTSSRFNASNTLTSHYNLPPRRC